MSGWGETCLPVWWVISLDLGTPGPKGKGQVAIVGEIMLACSLLAWAAASIHAGAVPFRPVPLRARPAICSAPANSCLLYVDANFELPYVEAAVESRGAEVILLSSRARAAAQDTDLEIVPSAGDEARWASDCLPTGTVVRGILCGDDGGLSEAERLADAIVPQYANGVQAARRDKFDMNEMIKLAGMATAPQLAPQCWDEVEAFLQTECGLPAVLKPRRGVASVMVGLADTEAEARRLYDALESAPRAETRAEDDNDDEEASAAPSPELGASMAPVVQQFLRGTEYIVDTVSRDGEHKVVALYRYEKGAANGAPFVYMGIEACGVATSDEEALASYATRALDALSWRWGPCHVELMLTVNGPRLVEMNMGRWNGIGFKRLADGCYGYNAYDAAIGAYLDDGAAWDLVPPVPPPQLRTAGRMVHLVATTEGVLRRVRHRRRIARLRSLAHFDPRPNMAGERLVRTTCFVTAAGEATLLHPDAAVVESDYATLQRLQPTLFAVRRGDARGGGGGGALFARAALRVVNWAVGRQRRGGSGSTSRGGGGSGGSASGGGPLYLRRGYVVQRVAARARRGGAATASDEQLIVLALEMQPGCVPSDGSMDGVRRVELASASGQVSTVEIARLCAPEYEVVTAVA